MLRLDKERESAAALAVLPDLLAELDALAGGAGARWLALVEGALAGGRGWVGWWWGAGRFAACLASYNTAVLSHSFAAV